MDLFDKLDELVEFVKKQENVDKYDALVMIGAALFAYFEDDNELEDFIEDIYDQLEEEEDFYYGG